MARLRAPHRAPRRVDHRGREACREAHQLEGAALEGVLHPQEVRWAMEVFPPQVQVPFHPWVGDWGVLP